MQISCIYVEFCIESKENIYNVGSDFARILLDKWNLRCG